MHTALCDTVGIEYPIFAFTHCRDVAVAVSRAGGLGVLGAVGLSPEQLEIELNWMDEHVDGMPYGVDVVMPQKSLDVHGSDRADLVGQIRSMIDQEHWDFVTELMTRFELPPLPEGTQAGGVVGWTEDVARQLVDVAFGHPMALIANALGSPPKDIVDRAHEHGVKVAALAGKAQHAQRHVNNGVDIVIAQGYEAGGHTGEIATMVLVPEVVKAVSPTPVLAAGGIGTGAQIAASLALGAQGVWMGSLWLATAESNSSPEGIEAYMDATSSDTVRSRSYTGKPARMLRNAWTDAWEDPAGPGPLGMPLQNILTAEANARIARAHRKDLLFAPIGQIVGSMNEVKPVRDVMFRLVEEYIEATERLAGTLDTVQSYARMTVPALAGLRVVDATEGIAGGYATKILRDLGADVTKVERAGGDPLRWWSAASPDEVLHETGALFSFLNAGKATVAATDTARVTEVALDADVVVVGDTMAPPGRGLETSVVTIAAFGDDGPLAGLPADEFTLQAWCGLMSGCGTRDTPPLQMGVGHGQWAAGAMGALAALAACEHRARTGTGADVEVSTLEVMTVCLLNYPTLYRHFTGSVSVMSRGGDWPQIVRCKGGWIGLCIFTPQQWDDFANMIGRPELVGDDRFNSMGGRGRNRELAQSVIRPWLEEHTADEIFELGGLFRVPVAYVGNGRDVLTMDHFRERGVFVENADGFLQPRSPFHVTPAPVPADGATPPAPVGRADRPLDGVTVLDFTAFWAGPAATHLLATLGADVVKIESPTRPDGMRFATTRPPTDPQWVEYSPTFHGTNPGKRSVAIDFSTPAGREVVLRLVERADVVVENFTPRVMPNVGLDHHTLAERRPDLIMLRMPAFGTDGPWRDHSGFAQTTEQVSGIAWLTGTAEIEPLVRSTVDPIAGIHGAIAVLAALADRRRSGVGQLIEMPMVEVAVNVAAEPIVTWSAYGTLLERQGNRGPNGVPQDVYACRGEEQWVAVSILTDEHWRSLCAVLGDPLWALDADLATRAGRRARADDVDRELAAWFAERDRDEVVADLLAAGVHAAPVWDQNLQDEMPQLAARGFTQWLDHPVAGPVGHPGTGLRSPQFETRYRSPAPTVGQHTGEVLRDQLHLSDAELAALVEQGAIGPV